MPNISCPNCGGDGKVNGRGGHPVACGRCNGSGHVWIDTRKRPR